MSIVVQTETQVRYVPPHKRGQNTTISESTHKNRNFLQSGTSFDTSQIVKRNRRRDLSQASKFNTKRSSPTRESPKVIKAIQVPIAVPPPIVESPDVIISSN